MSTKESNDDHSSAPQIRKPQFFRRRKSLFKKVIELSNKCQIPAILLIGDSTRNELQCLLPYSDFNQLINFEDLLSSLENKLFFDPQDYPEFKMLKTEEEHDEIIQANKKGKVHDMIISKGLRVDLLAKSKASQYKNDITIYPSFSNSLSTMDSI